jgi:hypothetical protein
MRACTHSTRHGTWAPTPATAWVSEVDPGRPATAHAGAARALPRPSRSRTRPGSAGSPAGALSRAVPDLRDSGVRGAGRGAANARARSLSNDAIRLLRQGALHVVMPCSRLGSQGHASVDARLDSHPLLPMNPTPSSLA